MIENIIFDMGCVLIEWNPAKMVQRIGIEGEDAALLVREVFSDSEWVGLDRGRLTEEEAIAIFRARLPERLHAAVERCVYWWREPVWPVPGMGDLVRDVKAAGYGVYLLSNAASALHGYFSTIPGSECFDGMIVSADWKLLKPQHEIYEKLYETYSLDPAKCFFIDDNPSNIDGAIVTGMDGVLFDGDLPRLRQKLRAAGIRGV